MKLVMVRHGETKSNYEMKKGLQFCVGCLNNEFSDLNEQGIRKAKELSQNEIIKSIHQIYVSNLRRAIDTVKYAKPNSNYTIIPALRERELGIFEGKTKDEIITNPEYIKYFEDENFNQFKDSFVQKAPEGENYNDVIKRSMAFLETLNYASHDIVGIFSHFCTIRCLFLGILNFKPKEDVFRLRIKNCEPYVFEGDSLKGLKLISHKLEEIID